MTRAVAAIAIAMILANAAASPALAKDRPMGWLATSVRSVFVFHSCTERLKEKFRIGPLNGLEVTDMDAGGATPDGAMDVRFEATTIERKTARKTRFVGVCHVGAEGETRVEARIVSQGAPSVIRRVPAKAG